MERPVVLVRHGALVLRQLPPGFRFHPTDEELVVQYLRRKAFSCPLPAAVIPEIDLGKFDPWDLPGANEGEKYFFTLQAASNLKGNRCSKRATGSGYWKATGKEKPILASRCSSNQLVGMKRALVFHCGKPPRASRTDWIMHEYRLAVPAAARAGATVQQKNASHNCLIQPKEWVVCRIFRKNKSRRSDGEIRQMPSNPAFTVHHTMHRANTSMQQPSLSLSSSSSCVTNILDQEEVSSSSNNAAALSQREA